VTPRVLVIGATGTQGNAVARELLARGRFQVRALTRRPRSTLACALDAAGAEIVEGDLASRASLRAALRGCQAVFGPARRLGSPDVRDVLGLNLINAVAGSTVDHFVLSDRLGHLERYARSLQLPATYMRPALYYERIHAALAGFDDNPASLARLVGRDDADRLPGIASDDIGGLVARALERPSEYLERRLHAVGDCRTIQSYAVACARRSSPLNQSDTSWRTNVASVDDRPTVDANASAGNGGLDDGTAARAIYPEIRDFDTWLTDSRAHLTQTLVQPPANDALPEHLAEPHRMR
jgi:uncharacterized protein YbjT (DUF2867 family)